MTDDRERETPRSSSRPMPPSVPPRPKRVSTHQPAATQPQARANEPVMDPTRAMPAQPAARQQPPSYPPQQRPSAPQAATYGTYDEGAQPATASAAGQSSSPRRGKHRCCRWAWILLAILVGALIVFIVWVNGQINHVDALSGAADTPGETTLIVGSDSREGWDGDDGTEGARTDTIMVLHKPESGPVALISIPRDSYVAIPGYKNNKINAAFSFGGPPLLVETVEDLTGLTMDHYMEIGLSGVEDMVDAVGGVELCYDEDVSDEKSGLEWEAGCHVADGETALAFSRMRYSDPLGDIGRAERQRQVVAAVAEEILSPATVLNPTQLIPVTSATLGAFRVDEGTNFVGLATIALDLRAGLGGNAVTGTPPITSLGHSVDGVGSTVLLTEDELPQFWEDIAEGNFEPGEEVGGVS
ncbi:LCP family protein, partial [Demequina sp. NBRC 110051]|uniref:LCP family protein n=1 Tax=Demequina sp. NBRC 110051 TaxID=1570340 RepID=UPI001F3B24B0